MPISARLRLSADVMAITKWSIPFAHTHSEQPEDLKKKERATVTARRETPLIRRESARL